MYVCMCEGDCIVSLFLFSLFLFLFLLALHWSGLTLGALICSFSNYIWVKNSIFTDYPNISDFFFCDNKLGSLSSDSLKWPLSSMHSSPVGWVCRIRRLHLCRGANPCPMSLLIWCKTIWWWGSSNAGVLGNTKYPFIVIAPRSTLALSGSTW